MGRHKKIKDTETGEYEKKVNTLDESRDDGSADNNTCDDKSNITELTPLINIQKEAEAGEKKSKYKEKKEKEKIKFKFLSKFPIIIINFLFLKFKVSELDDKEEKDLSEAFEGVIALFPDKWLKILEKLSPVVFFVYIVSMIVNKRRKELIEKGKNNESDNFKDDNDIINDFKND